MDQIYGLRIIQNKLAVNKRVEFKIERCSAKNKRRKAWRVLRIETNEPACWAVGDTFVMHPYLYERLKSASNAPLAHFASAK